jgi:exopolysaccharide biosynthesis predicted pyruvyltransferase EpsI
MQTVSPIMEARERNNGAPGLKLDGMPPEMAARFEGLAQTLLELIGDSKVYYHPNRGNWGDGLIRAGTHKFLADLSIDYQEQQHKRLKSPLWLRKRLWLRKVGREESVLIYGGGGAWCRFWDHTEHVRYLARHFRHIIVLPSSFDMPVTIPNATLFCRDDKESFRKVDATFCDDMAFYLGKQNVGPGQGAVNYFRGDVESARSSPLPPGNRDLSAEQNYLYPVEGFFEALEAYSHVKTDRLHVAIASCLMGKNVQLYPGAYFKNQSVFRSSIENNFPKASFVVP